jgi:RNA polymerase sigma-70 factor (ECF subfamily)
MRPADFIAEFGEIAARLYARSGASRWNVSEASFREALARAVERRIGACPDPHRREAATAFLETLHVEDLALALGCRAGDEAAWSEFDAKFRRVIEKTARAITRDSQRAGEIVNSLYGDLYGLAGGNGPRRSPLDHYHGRSALAAWLRVVIARREAQAWRVAYRSHGDGNLECALASAKHAAPEPEDPDRPRYLEMIASAMKTSLDSLAARDRLRLSYYYVQELTLAETGTLMGEHESTVSRNLARTRTEIRTRVEDTLRKEFALSDDQIGRCFEYATGDWPFDLARTLAHAK